MAKVTYVHPDGTKTTVDLPDGTTVMQGAIDNDIDGIEGACGGLAMCGTCHVFVNEPHLSELPDRSSDEDEMLDTTSVDRESDSRLGCQIEISDSLDGLVVRLPDSQS